MEICVVSIQLLFLFNMDAGQALGRRTEFQYSFCSYSTKYGMKFYKVDWFQYSFCSYSTRTYTAEDITNYRFNTASVLIQQNRIASCCWFEVVSIQLLFLFNNGSFRSVRKWLVFQYSFCSYSTLLLRFACLLLRFNTASVLIQQKEYLMQQHRWLGFNTASVLIQRDSERLQIIIDYGFNTASVLIQQKLRRKAQIRYSSFNTASVLIQPLVATSLFFVGWFQYSFCSYSTEMAKKTVIKKCRFNTASVLIQRLSGFGR